MLPLLQATIDGAARTLKDLDMSSRASSPPNARGSRRAAAGRNAADLHQPGSTGPPPTSRRLDCSTARRGHNMQSPRRVERSSRTHRSESTGLTYSGTRRSPSSSTRSSGRGGAHGHSASGRVERKKLRAAATRALVEAAAPRARPSRAASSRRPEGRPSRGPHRVRSPTATGASRSSSGVVCTSAGTSVTTSPRASGRSSAASSTRPGRRRTPTRRSARSAASPARSRRPTPGPPAASARGSRRRSRSRASRSRRRW